MNYYPFNTKPIAELMSWSIGKLEPLKRMTVYSHLADNLTDEELFTVRKYITLEQAEKRVATICDALLCFDWTRTKEGRAYFANIYSRFEV